MTRPLQLPPPLSDVPVTRAARLNVGHTEEGSVVVSMSGGQVQERTAVGFAMAPSQAKSMARQLKRLADTGRKIRLQRKLGGKDDAS